ncbi:transcriptional regulator [bacterium DOLZORAL124_64_63]|nr:MAG: transcriptional regulator [bacterium DOLZORAL124_64_63]
MPQHVIIHQSQVMSDLIELTDMFATTEEPVLITGETGTGKELIARRLHMHSSRANRKLVSVNVTAIPATMFEREMFGHVKGSFSGADRDGSGFVSEAEGGTLFLDEIGDLPAQMQPKLLRLLQEGTYQKLGDPTERHADIRIIAATNSSLQEKVEAGEFRSDIYFRLKVLGLELPPLRDRVGDVTLLMNHFLSEAAGKSVDMGHYFNPDSIYFLEQYEWPGNIRELIMLAKRAHVEQSTRGSVRITMKRAGQPSFILTNLEALAAKEAAAGAHEEESLGPETGIPERTRIELALERCRGNRVEAATKLQMGRSTLYRKMKKYGL